MSTLVAVIDDDAHDREMLCEAVAEFDNSFDCVSYGQPVRAMNIFLAPGAILPDYILLDSIMPIMSGTDCLIALRADTRYQATKIVMITTLLTTRQKVDWMKIGAYLISYKPESHQQMDSLMDNIFGAYHRKI